MLVILGLGSNLGDRLSNIYNAIELLQQGVIRQELVCSKIYESKALMPEDAMPEWDMPFINMAVKGETDLSPERLLQSLKAIEKKMGRLNNKKWAPREIDIDILAFGEQYINHNDLIIPHKELLYRNFALIPFAELWSDWQYPVPGVYFGQNAQHLAEKHSNAGDLKSFWVN